MTNTIGFPKLGLEFEINRIAFTVFGKSVYWYAVIILTGFLLGVLFVYKTCKKRGIEPDHIFDIGFYGLIAGIICARIYYVIFDPDCLDGSILNVIKIWEGGLAIYGGIIGAFLSTFIYCKIKKIPLLKTVDVCAPGLFIGQAIGRWGNFVNAEVYGKETSSLFGMSINSGTPVHPLFLYESLWNIAGLLILLGLRDKKKADGQVFLFYMLWYGAGRFFLEGMRQSEYILYLADGVGISQVVAVLFTVISLAGIIILGIKNGKKA